MSTKSLEFRDCVQKKIGILNKEGMNDDQAIAVAFSHCRKKFGIAEPPARDTKQLDALTLKNQPIAREGVLQYADGRKLKRWVDLEKNIGRIVPILDEHPPMNNGNYGMYSGKEKIQGWAEIKACPKGKNVLCADHHFFDNAVVKKGYSIGYPYEEDLTSGELDGQYYDEIQANLIVDHIAATNKPRDEKALQVLGDSKGKAKVAIYPSMLSHVTVAPRASNGLININRMAYDSIDFVDLDQQRSIMEIARKIQSDNPDSTAEEILARAAMIYLNECELEDPEEQGDKIMVPEPEKKPTVDVKPEDEEGCDSADREKLIRENAELKAKVANIDSIKAAEAELKLAKETIKAQDALLSGYKNKELMGDIDTLTKTHNCDAKDFDGKTPEFVNGALWFASHASKGQDKGTAIPQDKPRATSNKAGLRFSLKHGKYVNQDEWDG